MGDLRRLSQHGDRQPQRAVFLTPPDLARFLDWLFARGHAADIVLAVMAIELIALATLGGWSPRTALYRLLPGAMMIVALRAAMTGAGWAAIALPLALSFPVHLADLRRRGGPGVT